jgi:AbrB family looped-hinge helix DNA binding protein
VTRARTTTITSKNRISVPAEVLRELGWMPGDRLIMTAGQDSLQLVRQPFDWVADFSRQMGDVFGDHEDTLRYLDAERRGWSKQTSERTIHRTAET